ncbi:unnamed protein product, partial [marine sediment metagenome]
MSLPATEYLEARKSLWATLSSEKYFKWTLIIPLLLFLAVFMFYPLFYCLYYSAHNYVVVKPAEFVGWGMYRMVLRDPLFWTALGRTFRVLVTCIVAELITGMVVASLLNREFKGQNVVRGLCFLPLLIAPLGMSMFWSYMFAPQLGIINIIISRLGLPETDWFSPAWALNTIIFMHIWQWAPFSIFVLLAGMRSLPKDSFEAAKVDGASAWYTFRRLTLPMLMPLVMIIVLLRT